MKQNEIKLPDFDTWSYIARKGQQINTELIRHGIDTIIFGLSGGIDSAVVLGLLTYAQSLKDSPIKNIIPISVPFTGCKGSTDQDDAIKYAQMVNDVFLPNQPLKVMDLGNVYSSMLYTADVTDESDPWANGQMLSVLRTPLFYHQAALEQSKGNKSVVFGTCNLSEYKLGYWGKASDMMVDFQPIIDLYKSYVFNVAELLGVPQEIIDRKPKGDVWDGRTDEEMIGGSYPLIDKYLMLSEFGHEITSIQGYDLSKIKEHIDKNYHKFQVGNPCHKLELCDIYSQLVL